MSIRFCTLLVAFLLAVVCLPARSVEPSIRFDPDRVRVIGTPGVRFAWIAVGRDRHNGMSRLRSARGSAVADAQGAVTANDAPQAPRTICIAANVTSGEAIIATPSGYAPSATPVRIDAAAGAASVAVAAPVMKLLYVRPGEGAWTFSGKDGAETDADAAQNGLVTVPLQSLQAFQDSPPPPASTLAGDVIYVIDSRWMRVGKLVVSQ